MSDWAKDQGLPVSVVYALLSGRTRGRRGKAHRAAVALGMKPNIEVLPSALGRLPTLAIVSEDDNKHGEREP